jgi:NAD(P)H-hydrate epimerase
MQALDRRAMEEFGIPGLLLMENAGRGAAEVAARMAPGRPGGVLVFCGRGNNGGDGFVIARHLHNRGFEVRCYYAGDLATIRPGSDPWVNYEICRRMRIPVLQHTSETDREEMARAVGWTTLIIDALLGTGLTGTVREPFATLISMLNHRRAPILAVDLPSGMDADTGEILGTAVRATRTVSFGAPKLGFSRGQGPELTGPVDVIDISLPRQLLEE